MQINRIKSYGIQIAVGNRVCVDGAESAGDQIDRVKRGGAVGSCCIRHNQVRTRCRGP